MRYSARYGKTHIYSCMWPSVGATPFTSDTRGLTNTGDEAIFVIRSPVPGCFQSLEVGKTMKPLEKNCQSISYFSCFPVGTKPIWPDI